MTTSKWTPTLGEGAIGVGGVVALIASGAATAATVPAVVVIGGVLYAVRRSDAVQDAAQNSALLAPMALPGAGAALRQLPAPGGHQAGVEKPARPGLLRGLLESVLDDGELEELNAVQERRAPIHQVGAPARAQIRPVETPAKAQDDDGLVDDADFEVEDERPVLSMKEAMRTLPKLVLLGTLQPYPDSPLSVPMGINQYGEAVWGDFGEDLLHVGVYGTSGSGKDQLLRTWFALLAKRNDPRDVQFVFLDGKGDWMTPDMADLHCMWLPPAGGYGDEGAEAILTALKQVDAEARDRSKLIREAGCRSIEQFNQRYPGQARPLLFVMASDIGDIGGDSEKIFTALTQKARSLGFRIIASMQSPTGKKMDWRLNLSSLLAGAMVDSSQDGPALGVRETSHLPYRPSAIPQPPKVRGVFVARFRGEVMLVRTPMFRADRFENEDRFDRIVAGLPNKRPQMTSKVTRKFEPIEADETAEEYEGRVAGSAADEHNAGRPVVNGYAYTEADVALLARLNVYGSVKTNGNGSAGGSAAEAEASAVYTSDARKSTSEADLGTSDVKVRDTKTAVEVWQAASQDDRRKCAKVLTLMDKNGGKISPAVYEVYGDDTSGRVFQRIVRTVKALDVLRKAGLLRQ